MQTVALKDHLARHFVDLSPQLRLAARYVSDHPEDVAMQSLRQIARKSELSPPTYSRLARAIGFNNYENLRNNCRKELRQKQLSLADRAALFHFAASGCQFQPRCSGTEIFCHGGMRYLIESPLSGSGS